MAEREPCRLYLVSPPALEPAAFLPDLEAALDGGDVACFRLDLEDTDTDRLRAAALALAPACQARGVAFLLTGCTDLVGPTGADGVHVDGLVAGLRESLPGDAILGAGCGTSRHAALEAGEAEADYVTFSPADGEAALETLAWWAEMTVVPSVAAGGVTLGNAGRIAAAGADFVAVRGAVWQAPDGPGTAVGALVDAVASPGAR